MIIHISGYCVSYLSLIFNSYVFFIHTHIARYKIILVLQRTYVYFICHVKCKQVKVTRVAREVGDTVDGLSSCQPIFAREMTHRTHRVDCDNSNNIVLFFVLFFRRTYDVVRVAINIESVV